jgi:hypothetical protein
VTARATPRAVPFLPDEVSGERLVAVPLETEDRDPTTRALAGPLMATVMVAVTGHQEPCLPEPSPDSLAG